MFAGVNQIWTRPAHGCLVAWLLQHEGVKVQPSYWIHSWRIQCALLYPLSSIDRIILLSSGVIQNTVLPKWIAVTLGAWMTVPVTAEFWALDSKLTVFREMFWGGAAPLVHPKFLEKLLALLQSLCTIPMAFFRRMRFFVNWALSIGIFISTTRNFLISRRCWDMWKVCLFNSYCSS